jgi:predicted glycogen debranching enzyme
MDVLTAAVTAEFFRSSSSPNDKRHAMKEIAVDEKTCLNVREATELEWLDTNGIGGYASSTVIQCHTRKYHGLLVAEIPEAEGRYVLLSKVEDSLFAGDVEIPLACHSYPGVFSPEGYKFMKAFILDDAPRFVFRIGNTTVRKTVMLIREENSVMIRYDCGRSDAALTLRIRPFLAFRGFHDLSRENLFLHVRTYAVRNGFKIQPYDGLPPLFVRIGGRAKFLPRPLWYRRFEYPEEAARGFESHEDLFQPGLFDLRIKKGEPVFFWAGTKASTGSLRAKWEAEEKRRGRESLATRKVAKTFNLRNDEDRSLLTILIRAGRQFLVTAPGGRPAVIAGYPWFGVWGRDTLISVSGLTFCSGRPGMGAAILREIGKYQNEGLLPNFFADGGKGAGFNAVDASLWYFWAVQQFLKYTGKIKIVRKDLWPAMQSILRHYLSGTLHWIFPADSGLLHAGSSDVQLTWMDATVGGIPVTPRSGYAVEVNALWYNALCFAAELSEVFGEREFLNAELIERVRRSFGDVFWIEDGEYLGDVLSPEGLDKSVRPNQIFAVSLPYSPLDPSRWIGVVEKVRRELLTPFGLRTLSPGDPAYRGRYEGDPPARDAAYHQGTAWYWLIGHFGEALLKTASNKEEAREYLLEYLRTSLQRHLREGGLGLVGEIFDGDPPHRSRGCIAQAWSTAEAIRLYRLLGEAS